MPGRHPLTGLKITLLTYQEMAEVLWLPIGTIMSRMSRGKGLTGRRLPEPSPTAITFANGARNANWPRGMVARAE